MDQFIFYQVILLTLFSSSITKPEPAEVDLKPNSSDYWLDLHPLDDRRRSLTPVEFKRREVEVRYRSIANAGLVNPIRNADVSATPENVKDCDSTGEHCFVPLSSPGDQELQCLSCQLSSCLSFSLWNLPHYEWLKRNISWRSFDYQTFAPIKDCVTYVELEGLGTALQSGPLSYGCRYGRARMNLLNNYVPHGGTPPGFNYLKFNGTFMFRFHANTSNLAQTSDGNCSDVILYRMLDTQSVFLSCNEAGDNMDLMVGFTSHGEVLKSLEPSPQLILESVLNDDQSHSIENSIHVANVINTNAGTAALYVNGKLLLTDMSAVKINSLQTYSLYGPKGASGTLYDAYIFDDPLTEQLVYEAYSGQRESISPQPECYCPLSHPIVDNRLIAKDGTTTSSGCAQLEAYNVMESTSPFSSSSSDLTISRLSEGQQGGDLYPIDNIKHTDEDAYWLTGSANCFNLTFQFSDYYKMLGLEISMETLPDIVEVAVNEEIKVVYTTMCNDSYADHICFDNSSDILTGSSLFLDLLPPNATSLSSALLTDKIAIVFQGHHRHAPSVRMPYVINFVQAFAGSISPKIQRLFRDEDSGGGLTRAQIRRLERFLLQP